ncbi:MAG TPA: hypothetical protein VEP89_00640 [Draconibacterium sp.]|nr:hypothetical protein [Draconibacterium sp.]
MKNLILLFAVALLFACSTPQSKLQSTWKLVEYKGVSEGETVLTIPGNAEGEQLKSWSGEYFLFVGKFISKGVTSMNYGNGTYTLEGNHYTEHIDIHVSDDYAGRDSKLLLEFSGDTLIHIYPVNDDWTYDKDNYQMEKYIRVN